MNCRTITATDGSGERSDNNIIILDLDARADGKTIQNYMEDLNLKDFDDFSAPSKQSKSNGDYDEEDEDDLLALMDSAK